MNKVKVKGLSNWFQFKEVYTCTTKDRVIVSTQPTGKWVRSYLGIENDMPKGYCLAGPSFLETMEEKELAVVELWELV